MPRGRLLVVVLMALALIAGAASAPIATGQLNTSASIMRVPSLEGLLLQQVNAVRTANGRGRLSHSVALTRAAALHSRSMATFGFFTHESRDGAAFSTRIGRFYRPGARGWTVGENLAMSSGSVNTEAIVTAWMGSPHHRANLLGGTYRDAGIAIVHHPAAGGVFGGQPTWVVTLDIGRR